MKKLIKIRFVALFSMLSAMVLAQGVPVANFTVSPNPICSGAVITLQDLSSSSPTAWSYTISNPLPFPPPQVFTTQNPTLTFNGQGTFSITLIASNGAGSSTPVTHTISVLPGANGNVNPPNSNICLGSANMASISVVALGGPGGGGVNTYSWSTGSTATQIAVSPSVTTVYSCVITATNGCFITRTATVNVTPATVTITSNPANICPGTTSTLQVAGSGPGPWTYPWSNSSNSNSITSNVATIVSATIQNNSGCLASATYSLGSSSSLSLTTSSNPAVLCAGGVGSASISVSGASSYTWSNGITASSVIAVNPTATTVYSVFGTVGTCTGLTSYTLQVNRTPTITVVASATSICAGGSVSLTANGANSYTWTPGNIYTSTFVTPTLAVSTVYQIRGLNAGCPARTTTIAITVVPSPVVNIVSSTTVACNGDVVSLTAFGANTYTWSTGGSGAVLIQSPGVTTTYSVTGTNANNCTNSAAVTVSVNACTGLSAFGKQPMEFNVYPNPSHAHITIHANLNLDLNITNEFGQVVKSFTLTEGKATIDNLPVGVYFVVSRDQSVKQKIIILP